MNRIQKVASVNLMMGLNFSNHQLIKTAKELANNPSQFKRIRRIAFSSRPNYSSANPAELFSSRKINHDTKIAGKKISRIINPIPTKRTKYGTVSQFDSNSIGKLVEIGNLKRYMRDRLSYQELGKQTNRLDESDVQSIVDVTKDNINWNSNSNTYTKLLKQASPKVYQMYHKKAFDLHAKQERFNKIEQKKTQQRLNRHKHNELTKELKFEHGDFYQPLLNASSIRTKATQAKAKLTGSKKAKMTRLINYTNNNPCIMRFKKSWSAKTNPDVIYHQNQINLVYKYIKHHPNNTLSGTHSLLREDISSGRDELLRTVGLAFRDIRCGFPYASNQAKPNDLPKYQRQANEISDQHFYEKQYPYVKHAEYYGKKHHITFDRVYLAQYHAYYSHYDNRFATPSNWKKFWNLKYKAQDKQKAEHNLTHTISLTKPKVKHVIPIQTKHPTKEQIMRYRLNQRGMER